MKRLLSSLKVPLSFCVLLLTLMTGCTEEKASQQKKPPVRVVASHPNSVQSVGGLRYVGVIEEESSTAVSFTGSGLITRMDVTEGQRVRKGQFIAQLDTTQASNLINTAKAQLAQARDAYSRMKQMYDEGALPEIKWVEVQTQVDQAEVVYEAALKSRRDCTVYSPVSGVVGKKAMRAGETALPAQPVCTILNIDQVKVKVGVPEKEFSSITSSTQTNIYIEALTKLVRGGRIEKGVTADAVTHTYDMYIHLNNPDMILLPGMICKVEIAGDASDVPVPDGLLSVPLKAVRQGSNGSMFVWAIEEGKACRKPVVLGESKGDEMTILSGLTTETLVITEGYQKVSEGTDVQNIKEEKQ